MSPVTGCDAVHNRAGGDQAGGAIHGEVGVEREPRLPSDHEGAFNFSKPATLLAVGMCATSGFCG